MGLSPLARGNRTSLRCELSGRGPIPARAGEPPSRRMAGRLSSAYPRSRGGTVVHTGMGPVLTGLSPLARGNLDVDNVGVFLAGPIPASAGEPLSIFLFLFRGRAYPRSRGGTAVIGFVASMSVGLSPLARGTLS